MPIATKPAIGVALLAAAASAGADPYRLQVSGGVEQLEAGLGPQVDSRTLVASYYFQPVDEASGPLAQAAFLGRNSRASLTIHEDEQGASSPIAYGTGPLVFATTVRKTLGYGLSGRHVWRDSGWYIGAHGDRSDADAVSSTVTQADAEAYGLSAGKYVLDSTAVGLSWASTTTRTSVANLACPVFVPCTADLTTEFKIAEVAAGVQHVGEFGRFGYTLSGTIASSKRTVRLNLPVPTVTLNPPTGPVPPLPNLSGGYIAVVPFAPVSNPSRQEQYSMAGELFPRRRLGIRLGYSRWDGDLTRDERYELGTTWFFLPSVALQATVSRTRGKASGTSLDDIDTAALRFIGRL